MLMANPSLSFKGVSIQNETLFKTLNSEIVCSV